MRAEIPLRLYKEKMFTREVTEWDSMNETNQCPIVELIERDGRFFIFYPVTFPYCLPNGGTESLLPGDTKVRHCRNRLSLPLTPNQSMPDIKLPNLHNYRKQTTVINNLAKAFCYSSRNKLRQNLMTYISPGRTECSLEIHRMRGMHMTHMFLSQNF